MKVLVTYNVTVEFEVDDDLKGVKAKEVTFNASDADKISDMSECRLMQFLDDFDAMFIEER